MRSAMRMLVGAGCVTLAAAVGGVPTLQCVGRVAHEVTISEDEADVVVVPAPGRDGECEGGGSIGKDRQICVGVNQDMTCTTAVDPVIGLPHDLKCEGCFMAATTDMYYSLNITRLRISSIRLGLRGTKLLGALSLEVDETKSAPDRQGSVTFGGKPLEWKIKISDKLSFDVKISLPVELHYQIHAAENGHGDVGADVVVDLGDNYVQYTEGTGFDHQIAKPKLTVTPIHEGDYLADVNLTIGARARLQAEVGQLMWYHLDAAPEVPLSVQSQGATGAPDVVHTCVQATGSLHVSHEAEVDLSFFNHTIAKRHWGPIIDHDVNAPIVSRCADVHPKAAEVIV